ncbi:MAG: DUF3817 domain-containing protein [Microbacteriaceae bacterium]
MMKRLNAQLLAAVPPARLFTIFAFAEMVTWAGLITAMVVKYTGVSDAFVPIAGGIHGFVFLCYSVTTVFVWVNQSWPAKRGVVGLLSAIIPFATVPFEHSMKKNGHLEGEWRLAPGKDTPHGFIENVQAWVLRNLSIAIVLGIILITIIFVVLLNLGSPIPVSSP